MFVAVRPDPETKERLAGLDLSGEKGLRPVGPDRWHVTLRFLGEVDDALVPDPADPEPRFNGHLTLARSKGRRLGVAALGEMSAIPFEAAFRVNAIDLVASEPSPQGHIYSTVVRARLGKG